MFAPITVSPVRASTICPITFRSAVCFTDAMSSAFLVIITLLPLTETLYSLNNVFVNSSMDSNSVSTFTVLVTSTSLLLYTNLYSVSFSIVVSASKRVLLFNFNSMVSLIGIALNWIEIKNTPISSSCFVLLFNFNNKQFFILINSKISLDLNFSLYFI